MEASYRLSFTAVSLGFGEALKIAEVYAVCQDWKRTRDQVLGDNLLQARTPASAKRTYQEMAPRLQGLTAPQLELLLAGSLQEQRYLLWYAVCKRYAYVREFAIEVVRDRFLVMDYQVTESDYDSFFRRKASGHPELEALKESTQRKIQTVLFRMLREAGIVSAAHTIVPAVLPRRLIAVLAPEAPLSYAVFPIHPLAL